MGNGRPPQRKTEWGRGIKGGGVLDFGFRTSDFPKRSRLFPELFLGDADEIKIPVGVGLQMMGPPRGLQGFLPFLQLGGTQRPAVPCPKMIGL